jgi:hypothetical protein
VVPGFAAGLDVTGISGIGELAMTVAMIGSGVGWGSRSGVEGEDVGAAERQAVARASATMQQSAALDGWL